MEHNLGNQPCPYEFVSGCFYDDCWYSHDEKFATELQNWDCRLERDNKYCPFIEKIGCGFKHHKQYRIQTKSVIKPPHSVKILFISASNLKRNEIFKLLYQNDKTYTKQKFQDFDVTVETHKITDKFTKVNQMIVSPVSIIDMSDNSNKKSSAEITKIEGVNVICVVLRGSESKDEILNIYNFVKSIDIQFNIHNLTIYKPPSLDLPQHIQSFMNRGPLNRGLKVNNINSTNAGLEPAINNPPQALVEEIFCLKNAHQGPITCLSFGGNRLVSGSIDKCIKIFKFKSEKDIVSLEEEIVLTEATEGWIWAVAVCQDGKYVASGSVDNYLRIYNLETDQKQISQNESKGIIHAVAISPDSNEIVYGCKGGWLEVFNMQNKQNVMVDLKCAKVSSIAYLDNQHIVVATNRGRVLIYNLKDGSICLSEDKFLELCRGDVTFEPRRVNSCRIFSRKALKAYTFDSKLNKLKLIHDFKTVHNGPITAVAIYDSSFIISGSEDRSIKIFDVVRKKQLLHISNAHEGEHPNCQILSLLVTKEGLIISGSIDKSIKIFRPDWKSLKIEN